MTQAPLCALQVDDREPDYAVLRPQQGRSAAGWDTTAGLRPRVAAHPNQHRQSGAGLVCGVSFLQHHFWDAPWQGYAGTGSQTLSRYQMGLLACVRGFVGVLLVLWVCMCVCMWVFLVCIGFCRSACPCACGFCGCEFGFARLRMCEASP
jgi:hypothetical protein